MTKKTKKEESGFVEFIKALLWAIPIALLIRTVAFESFRIPSGSMYPTNEVGDFLFVSKYSYGYSRFAIIGSFPLFEGRILGKVPERGDVAVFRLPEGRSSEKMDYIKRVIGLPGDRIQVFQGVLHINGTPVKLERIEDYEKVDKGVPVKVPQYLETLPNGVTHRILKYAPFGSHAFDNTVEYVVPEGHLFMMGDNRDQSLDSRSTVHVGFIPMDHLIGRAQLIFMSIDTDALSWRIWEIPFLIRFKRIFSLIR